VRGGGVPASAASGRLKFRAEDSKERSVCYKQGAFASQEARRIALDSDWRAELKSAMYNNV